MTGGASLVPGDASASLLYKALEHEAGPALMMPPGPKLPEDFLRDYCLSSLVLAARFTDAGAAEWIWQSLAKGEAFDSRYEDLMRHPRPGVEKLVSSKEQSS